MQVDFWKSSGSGLRIRTLNPDQIRLGGGLRSPNALVISIISIIIIILINDYVHALWAI